MFTKVTTAAVLLLSSCVVLAQGREGPALEQADADHDGKVTKQEYVDARAAQFSRLDRNGDGFIDDADSRAGGNERGQRAAKALRGRIDSNGDGKISKEEFVNAPTMLFDKFDANKDGVLDATELEAARNAAGRWRERTTQ
ncbi:MAG TPA: EF-hand domain-containing protein [Steroidobacteraceae bacterium]|jgi:Ca2+-binding EF-hand superfamily protein|nr:EF-hand domain-containing protein [Steroidobacteraceae bacterium]